MPIRCYKCRALNDDDTHFCEVCGTYLGADEEERHGVIINKRELPPPASPPTDHLPGLGELINTAVSSGVSAIVGGMVAWFMAKLPRRKRRDEATPEIVLPPGVERPEK